MPARRGGAWLGSGGARWGEALPRAHFVDSAPIASYFEVFLPELVLNTGGDEMMKCWREGG